MHIKTMVVVALCAGSIVSIAAPEKASGTALVVREARYEAALSDAEARFTVTLDLDALRAGSMTLFEGNVAVLPPTLPEGLLLARDAGGFRISATHEGRYTIPLELVAKITRAEPWNQVCFTGPPAVISSIKAHTSGAGMEVQLLAGTVLDVGTNAGIARVSGYLGSERAVSLRWQSKAAEVARAALLTCETEAKVAVMPTVVRYSTQFRYDIAQSTVTRLTIQLPVSQALTKIEGEGVRDWQTRSTSTQQILSVELIRPVEGAYTLSVWSEQAIEQATGSVAIVPPQPLGTERETGTLTVSAEDVLAATETATGMRQVNAAADAVAAYQFHTRPFSLALSLQRIEPMIQSADRVAVRLEETRLLVTHTMSFDVTRAGIYALELAPQPGLAVTDVRGKDVEDWKVPATTGTPRLLVSFSSRKLGTQTLVVQLEQTLKSVPDKFDIRALRVKGALRETAQIGVTPAPGIQVKTAVVQAGVREVPVTFLTARADEVLAYTAEQPEWTLGFAAERLAERVTAEVFNLVTVGDGIVAGSATIRLAIFNQGAQQFRIALPSYWKNVEFIGANIRRKERTGDVWTITLQEKVWGGYTLVVTYDYQFKLDGTTLPAGCARVLDAERTGGCIAITSAGTLEIREASAPAAVQAAPAASAAVRSTIHRIDESELPENDRALITRSVVLAYRYDGAPGDLSLALTRFNELPILEAVADRTQLTTVLNESGQLLTEASFMVKNNEKHYQTITLPEGAEFWSCFVAGAPAKAERNGTQLMIPLPRGANRDQAFTVNIVYAQKTPALPRLFPRALRLAAPITDLQTTYAEWELYVPSRYHVGWFRGNMSTAPGMVYTLADALRMARAWYLDVPGMAGGIFLLLVIASLVMLVVRKRWLGAILNVLVIVVVLVMLTSTAGRKAQRYAARASYATRPASEPQSEQSPLNYAAEGDDAPVRPATPSVQPPSPPAATASGINPIRIEIPRTGRKLVFTKVLNVRGEPLSVTALALKNTAFYAVRAIVQLCLVLVGIALFCWQWRKERISSLLLALGAALVATAAASVFVSLGILHIALIAIGPLALFCLLLWLFSKVWKKRTDVPPLYPPPYSTDEAASSEPGPSGSQTPSASSALLVVLLGLACACAYSQEPEASLTADTIACVPGAVPRSGVAVLSATYAGSVRDAGTTEQRLNAELDAEFLLNVTDSNQVLRLFGPEVAVKEINVASTSWGGYPATGPRAERDGNVVTIVLPTRGTATVRAKILVKLAGDATQRRLSFSSPYALCTQLALTLDESDAVIEVPTAISHTTTPVTGAVPRTRIDAVMGAGDHIELSWTPRTKKAAEISATVFCQNNALVSFGGGVMHVQSILDYQISQGELRMPRVRVPAGQRLMRVQNEAIRTWRIETDSTGQVLVVELVKGIAPSFRMTIETEKPLDAASATTMVQIPHALDVKRETGLVALMPSDELSMSVDAARDVQKADLDEFTRGFGATVPHAASGGGVASAYRFLRPGFELAVRTEPMRPQIEVDVRQSVRIAADQISLAADLGYQIKRAGIFSLRVSVPVGYRIARVTGTNIAQWVEKDAQGTTAPRMVEITLKERTIGAYRLQIELARTVTTLPPSFAIMGVQPLDVQKLTGYVAVSAEEGLQIKSESFDGLTEVPAATIAAWTQSRDARDMGRMAPVLAFKVIPSDTATAARDWRVVVGIESIESWVRAEVINLLTFTETRLSGRSVVRFDVQNSPTKEFRVKVPAACQNVQISCAQARRIDQQTNEWRIELQNKVRGTLSMEVTWDRSLNPDAPSFSFSGVEAVGVERETGMIALMTRPPISIEVGALSPEVLKAHDRDMPAWAGTAPPSALLYRYMRPGYSISLAAKRHDEAEVLQMIVEKVELTSVISKDGQMMTEMRFTVRNNGRQHLELRLPPGVTSIWSAFVADQPVRPSIRDGKVIIPLDRVSSESLQVAIDVTYVGSVQFPARAGSVQLDTPAFDVPLQNATWTVYAPAEYSYGRFSGSMEYQEASTRSAMANLYTSVSSFSLGEYVRQMNVFEARRKSQTRACIANMRNVDSALQQALIESENYKQLDNAAVVNGNDDTIELQRTLKRAAGNKMLQGQYEFNKANAVNGENQLVAGAMHLQSTTGATTNYAYTTISAREEEVAESQALGVVKGQEITVTKAMPLRVNLPVCGVPLSFAQSLQTEVNKPLTLQFAASRTDKLGISTAVGAAAFFAALWGAATLLVHRMRRAA